MHCIQFCVNDKTVLWRTLNGYTITLDHSIFHKLHDTLISSTWLQGLCMKEAQTNPEYQTNPCIGWKAVLCSYVTLVPPTGTEQDWPLSLTTQESCQTARRELNENIKVELSDQNKPHTQTLQQPQRWKKTTVTIYFCKGMDTVYTVEKGVSGDRRVRSEDLLRYGSEVTCVGMWDFGHITYFCLENVINRHVH